MSDPYAINLQNVVNSDMAAVIRMAAYKLLQTSYLDVGTFLKDLSKPDLAELVTWCNALTMKIDTPPMLENLFLLGEMLAQAEGTPLNTPDAQRTANLIILLTFEDLHRKGVIEFNRSRATLFGALEDLNVARLK